MDAFERNREAMRVGPDPCEVCRCNPCVCFDEPEAELEPLHASVGSRFVESSNYEGWLHQCLCGERFMEESELQQHVDQIPV